MAIPANIINRPPTIQYFLQRPGNILEPIGGEDGLEIGHDTNNMSFQGFVNSLPFNTPFRIYYVIYDRPV